VNECRDQSAGTTIGDLWSHKSAESRGARVLRRRGAERGAQLGEHPGAPEESSLLVEGLVVVDKYGIDRARALLRMQLTKFINDAPLRVYAIASRFGFDEEAEAASSLTIIHYLPALTDLPDDMKYVPVSANHKLVVLHSEHRDPLKTLLTGCCLSVREKQTK